MSQIILFLAIACQDKSNLTFKTIAFTFLMQSLSTETNGAYKRLGNHRRQPLAKTPKGLAPRRALHRFSLTSTKSLVTKDKRYYEWSIQNLFSR
jgi:hypothetical protein